LGNHTNKIGVGNLGVCFVCGSWPDVGLGLRYRKDIMTWIQIAVVCLSLVAIISSVISVAITIRGMKGADHD
jgi:hypothetical protein